MGRAGPTAREENQVGKISDVASVTANVAQGLNTLQFLVANGGGGVTGLAAGFTINGNASLVPEPGSFALFLLK